MINRYYDWWDTNYVKDFTVRNISERGVEFIASFEGFVDHPYNDAATPPNATIGFGHLIHAGPVTSADKKKWGRITREEGLDLLREDLDRTVEGVNSLIKVHLGILPAHTQARFDMLVSFAFNVGVGGLEVSSLLREINRRGAVRNWKPVVPLWEEWDHAGGAVLPGLLKRRQFEVKNFIAGKYIYKGNE